MLIRETPIKVYLEGYENKVNDLKSLLTYKNRAAEFELRRFKKARWYLNQHGEEAYNEKLEELKAAVTVCLLKEDKNGLWTYAGLTEMLARHFNDQTENKVEYPESKIIPWANMPKYDLRYYQKDSVEKLLAQRHGAIELMTGGGKSLILVQLLKELGLQAVIMVPSVSIARQLYSDFIYAFGKKYVGLIGDGSKDYKKLFTIGIAASLTKIEPGTDMWKKLSKAQVFATDEAHLTAADTLERVCHGLCANAAYRFFVSGTQMRNDGADMLLNGIIGPIVLKMDVRQGVDEGFLAKPNFMVVRSVSPSSYVSDDHQKMMDKHVYCNAKLAQEAAQIINQSIELLGHQVLVLTEHIEQFQYILPHLKYEYGIAHGGVTKANSKYLDPRFHKSDPEALVKSFNDGELKLLLGTSCISIGTDIRPCKTIVNLQGGQSEIKIRQALGRGTRRVPGKDSFNYVDFDVVLPNMNVDAIDYWDMPAFMRHTRERMSIYEDVYGPVTYIK